MEKWKYKEKFLKKQNHPPTPFEPCLLELEEEEGKQEEPVTCAEHAKTSPMKKMQPFVLHLTFLC